MLSSLETALAGRSVNTHPQLQAVQPAQGQIQKLESVDEPLPAPGKGLCPDGDGPATTLLDVKVTP